MGLVRALVLLTALGLVQNVAATQFTVGGSSGWAVPSDNGAAYNQWAERMRFQIGDSLLFVYPSSSDSVLRVTKDDYTNCKTASPLEKFTDGHTMVTLSESGPHYFISGNKDNCHKNEKIVVVVLADRTNKGVVAPAPAPYSTAPPPAPPVQTPSPAPTATTPDQSPPSPAPEATSSPPSPTPEATSTPAPTQDDNHNGGSSIASSRIIVGVFAGLVALLAAL